MESVNTRFHPKRFVLTFSELHGNVEVHAETSGSKWVTLCLLERGLNSSCYIQKGGEMYLQAAARVDYVFPSVLFGI